jgi:hypothetical protein
MSIIGERITQSIISSPGAAIQDKSIAKMEVRPMITILYEGIFNPMHAIVSPTQDQDR